MLNPSSIPDLSFLQLLSGMLPRFAKHCNIVTVNLQQSESIILWVAKVFLPLGCSEWEEGESDIQVCTAVIEHVKGQSGNNTKDEAFL